MSSGRRSSPPCWCIRCARRHFAQRLQKGGACPRRCSRKSPWDCAPTSDNRRRREKPSERPSWRDRCERTSRRSPSTRSTASPSRDLRLLVGRTSTRTECPAARSCRATWLPTKPVAPVTSVVIEKRRILEANVIDSAQAPKPIAALDLLRRNLHAHEPLPCPCANYRNAPAHRAGKSFGTGDISNRKRRESLCR